MSENETPTSTPEQTSERPKKSDRGALIFVIAMVLGLFALVALNMK